MARPHNLNANVVFQSGAQASPTLGGDLGKLPFWAAGLDGTGEVGVQMCAFNLIHCMCELWCG